MTLAAPPAAARTATCPLPGCISIADPAPRKEWENPDFCAKHRQQARQRAGACLNCGAALEAQPELNLLTGKQLRRDGELVSVLVCAERCGYSRRPRPGRPAARHGCGCACCYGGFCGGCGHAGCGGR